MYSLSSDLNLIAQIIFVHLCYEHGMNAWMAKSELTFKVHLFICLFFSSSDCNSLELLKELCIMAGQLIIIKVGYRGLIAQSLF